MSMTIDAGLHDRLCLHPSPLVQAAPPRATRHPDSWAAYGRFIFESVRTRCSRRVEALNEGLLHFRRPFCTFDTSLVYAFQDCASPTDSIWTTATGALQTLCGQARVDHLNVYVAGAIPPEDAAGTTLRAVLDGSYIGIAIPRQTRDILEFPPTFEGFLQTLGHSNRRHMKARQQAALASGIRFEIAPDRSAVAPEERYLLGERSRPFVYTRKRIDSWDAYAMAQPRFFQCTLRSPAGELLSCCTGFMERDTAVMMYQLNHEDYPRLGLSMTLRGFLIRHCTDSGLRRLVLPMGVAGNLEHAATTNPIAQIQFVRRSLPSLTKALLLRLTAPASHCALLVGSPGFAGHFLASR